MESGAVLGHVLELREEPERRRYLAAQLPGLDVEAFLRFLKAEAERYWGIDPLVSLTVAETLSMAAALAGHVGGDGDITYSTNNGLIEIVPRGISKATGIDEIAAPLGITAGDVITFGDMPNDVPMLRWAGHGVAMGNAHPDALAAADEVTTSNSDDGLARVLERWWL